MAMVLVDIDEDALERAANALGLKTTTDTVNAALREAARSFERLQALERLGEMADRGDFDEFLASKSAYRR
jgi:Arc/MetJ family transcription regulator